MTDEQPRSALTKYGLIRYQSMRNVPPPRWLRFLSRVFRFSLGTDRSEAFGSTYAELARHVTINGIEPGYRAEQTKQNGGRGLDFYSLDRWRCDPNEVASTWITDTDEPKREAVSV